MRVGFFGDGPWAIKTLEEIYNLRDLSLAFVVGRWPHADQQLKNFAEKQAIPFYSVQNVNSSVSLGKFSSLGADIFLSVSYNQIFKRDALKIPEMGIINCHAGKLPYYRGRNVLNWALINDEKEFGITVHYVDEGIDTGDIILQEVFPISDDDSYQSLLSRAYEGCPVVVKNALIQLRDGYALRIKQSDIHPTGFYCPGRSEGDEWIDWSLPARDIFNFVRALREPGPGARSLVKGAKVIVQNSEIIEQAPIYKAIPGSVLSVEDTGILVKTGDSFIRLTEWHATHRFRVGDRLQ